MTGCNIIVTGASSGLGLALTRHLATHGATVLMAVRDPEKGERVRRDLSSANLDGTLEVWPLDLLDLDSVRRFADGVRDDGRPIDVLVNNAGISNQPRRLSSQGYESQFATNHLGHFALTGLLLESLERGDDPRVVTMASGYYRYVRGGLNFNDLNGEKRYSPIGAYARSKLANVLFGLDLERRLRAADSPVRSLIAHPGIAATSMSQSANSTAERLLAKAITLLMARPAEQSVLPILYATAATEAGPGVFIGPTGPRQNTRVTLDDFVGPATDEQPAVRLWDVSEELTGVRYLDT
ncbi:MAG: SDR family NAD(P)-dependent oxidoreductase [Actinomycetota bacterium]|nr:SDR family NAD(P)-dependent oxidoreductase [Actinomycetota bacterium]